MSHRRCCCGEGPCLDITLSYPGFTCSGANGILKNDIFYPTAQPSAVIACSGTGNRSFVISYGGGNNFNIGDTVDIFRGGIWGDNTTITGINVISTGSGSITTDYSGMCPTYVAKHSDHAFDIDWVGPWAGHNLTLNDVSYSILNGGSSSLQISNPPSKSFQLGLTTNGSGYFCGTDFYPDPAPTGWLVTGGSGHLSGPNVNTKLSISRLGVESMCSITGNTTSGAKTQYLGYPYGEVDYSKFDWSINITTYGNGGSISGDIFTPATTPIGWSGDFTGHSLSYYTESSSGGPIPILSNSDKDMVIDISSSPIYSYFSIYFYPWAFGDVVSGVFTCDPNWPPVGWHNDKLIGASVTLNGNTYTITDNTTTSCVLSPAPVDMYSVEIDFTIVNEGFGARHGTTLIPDDTTGFISGMFDGCSITVDGIPMGIVSNSTSDITLDSAIIPLAGWSIDNLTISGKGTICNKTITTVDIPYWGLGWTGNEFNGATIVIDRTIREDHTYTITSNDSSSIIVESDTDHLYAPYSWSLLANANYQSPVNIMTSGGIDINGNTITTTSNDDTGWYFNMNDIYCTIDGTEYTIINGNFNGYNSYNHSLTLNNPIPNTFNWSIDCNWNILDGEFKTRNIVGTPSAAQIQTGPAKTLWEPPIGIYQYNLTVDGDASFVISNVGGLQWDRYRTLTIGSGHGFSTGDRAIVGTMNLKVTNTTDDTITVDMISNLGSIIGIGTEVYGTHKVKIYFGPDGSYEYTSERISKICVFYQDGFYTILAHGGLVEETGWFQQKVDKATWEASPHKIGIGGDSLGRFGTIHINQTKLDASSLTNPVPPTGCINCDKNCSGCLHDENPDCYKIWITDLKDMIGKSQARHPHCTCKNGDEIYLPQTDVSSEGSCEGLNGKGGLGNYGDSDEYILKIVKDVTTKHWELILTVDGKDYICNNVLIPSDSPIGWIEDKLIDCSLIVNGTPYNIIDNTSNSITIAISDIDWFLNIMTNGTGATFQDGDLIMAFYPIIGWFEDQLIGSHITLNGVNNNQPLNITDNTTSGVTVGNVINNFPWSIQPVANYYTDHGHGYYYATLQDNVLTPPSTGTALGWGLNALTGKYVTIDGSLPAHYILSNTITDLTTSGTPQVSWLIDVPGSYGGNGIFHNKILTPNDTPEWVEGEFDGETILIDNDETIFTIDHNTTSGLTTTENKPHGSHQWTIPISPTGGSGSFYNKVLTPAPTVSWTNNQFSGLPVTIASTQFTILGNNSTTLTTTGSKPLGNYSWNLDIVNSGRVSGWCNGIMTPVTGTGSFGWQTDHLTGIMLSINNQQYPIISNTTNTINVGGNINKVSWELDIPHIGEALIDGTKLTPLPSVSWHSGSLEGMGIKVWTNLLKPDEGHIPPMDSFSVPPGRSGFPLTTSPGLYYIPYPTGFPVGPFSTYKETYDNFKVNISDMRVDTLGVDSNTATDLELSDNSPGDTTNGWFLRCQAENAMFQKYMGKDPIDCMYLDDEELEYTIKTPRLSDNSTPSIIIGRVQGGYGWVNNYTLKTDRASSGFIPNALAEAGAIINIVSDGLTITERTNHLYGGSGASYKILSNTEDTITFDSTPILLPNNKSIRNHSGSFYTAFSISADIKPITTSICNPAQSIVHVSSSDGDRALITHPQENLLLDCCASPPITIYPSYTLEFNGVSDISKIEPPCIECSRYNSPFVLTMTHLQGNSGVIASGGGFTTQHCSITHGGMFYTNSIPYIASYSNMYGLNVANAPTGNVGSWEIISADSFTSLVNNDPFTIYPSTDRKCTTSDTIDMAWNQSAQYWDGTQYQPAGILYASGHRTGITISSIGYNFAKSYYMVIDKSSGSGDNIPTIDNFGGTICCKTRNVLYPGTPGTYSLILEDGDGICLDSYSEPYKFTLLSLAIASTTYTDYHLTNTDTTNKIKFTVTTPIGTFVGFRDDCAPSGWTIYPETIVESGPDGNGNYLVLQIPYYSYGHIIGSGSDNNGSYILTDINLASYDIPTTDPPTEPPCACIENTVIIFNSTNSNGTHKVYARIDSNSSFLVDNPRGYGISYIKLYGVSTSDGEIIVDIRQFQTSTTLGPFICDSFNAGVTITANT